MREAELKRKTTETNIEMSLQLDGCGASCVNTGCGFLDHMLTLFAKYARVNLTVSCKDLEHVKSIVSRLRQVKDVTDVLRGYGQGEGKGNK